MTALRSSVLAHGGRMVHADEVGHGHIIHAVVARGNGNSGESRPVVTHDQPPARDSSILATMRPGAVSKSLRYE